MTGVELVILALEGKELFVGTLFDDTSVVEDDDLVGIADGAEAVGDDKGGSALCTVVPLTPLCSEHCSDSWYIFQSLQERFVALSRQQVVFHL